MPDRYAAWLERDVVRAAGPEAEAFLQGQLSQDVSGVADGGSAWSWVLAPTGKVDALVRVTRLSGDDWLLDTDRGWADLLLARLNRFKLRTKVELTGPAWSALGLRGEVPDAAGVVAADPAWPGVTGIDLFGPDLSVPDGWPVISAAAYEAVRITAGIPKMGAELTERTIPAETGLVPRTVSFTKGCYTGQELVARIDSRGGQAPRHLRGLRSAEAVAAGTELFADGDEKPAGTITSAAAAPGGGWVGLGYVRRGIDPPIRLRAGPAGPSVDVTKLAG